MGQQGQKLTAVVDGAGGLDTVAAPRLAAEAIGVSKTFGSNKAVSDVSMAVTAGESRALVGRNGAGKSTLVAALTGLIAPDAGRIRLAGVDAPTLADRAAWRQRVACVYQRSTVVPTLTVAENLFLNAHPTFGGQLINWNALHRRAEAVLDEWGLSIDVEQDAQRLTVEQRQIVEIARALIQGTRFIILDEPTAELEGREVARLFERIHGLQQGGVTFLYISHHLEEIYEVCRTVTVLRDGRLVTTAPLADMPKAAVVVAMVGDATRAAAPRSGTARAHATCLTVTGLTVATLVRDVSFEVGTGECVGITGLAGSGKDEIGEAVAGLLRPDSGRITLAGAELPHGSVIAARHAGIGYVPRDRRARGIVPQLSVAENLTLTIVERLGRLGLVSPAERERQARRMIGDLQLVASSPDQPIGELSGGNQQKAMLGRALASDPRLLILVHPTQGVDIASKEALIAIVAKAQAKGTAVMVISDDLDELTICDRVLVVLKGRLTAAFAAGWQDRDLVMAIEGVATIDRVATDG